MYALRILFVGLTGMLSTPASAALLSVASNACVMQQPTSHYYHFCYGLDIAATTDSERIGLTASYIERPEFSSGGFADKEFLTAARLTTKLTKKKGHGLYAGFGAGQLQGYIKSTEGDYKGVTERAYALNGPVASISYAYFWRKFSLRAHHETFVGYVSQQQLESLVAWPYNFYGIKMGYSW